MVYTERGYDANANNFGTAEGKVKVLTKYNPVNTLISKANIALKKTAINDVLADVTTKESAKSVIIASRQDKFDDVESKATRIGGAFASCNVTEREIVLVHNQVKVVRGERIKALKKPVTPATTTITTTTDTTETPAIITETPAIIAETPAITTEIPTTTTETVTNEDTNPLTPLTPTTHSVSHSSFGGLVRSLNALIALLIAVPNYDSNDPDLKPDALTLWVKGLEDISILADDADNAVVASKVIRDNLFYDAADSAEKMVVKIKNEVLASYGATSKEYKEIKAIPFVDNRKKV